MAPPILHLRDIHLTLGGGAPLLDGAELFVAPGERVCLVGRNGSGKSTLLKVAAGMVAAEGERFVQPGTTMRYLPQEPDFTGCATIGAYVHGGLGPADAPYRADALMQELGLDPEASPANLSGGEARRAALARTLAPEPDLLLLDEPTNHLDLPAIEWLEQTLAAHRGGFILISHDRRLLERASSATIWLDRGRTRRMERGFAQFEAWKDEVLAAEELEQHKLDRAIVREEHWMRYGVTARRKRNVRRVAELAALREARKTHVRPTGTVKMEVAQTTFSGRLISVAENISLAYDGRPIVKNFSARIMRGDRVGLVGPNGAGKTTLLKLLTGQIAPDSGEVKIGTNLDIVTLDQTRATLDNKMTLADTLTGGGGDQVDVRGEKRHVIGYMKDFLFRPEQARTPVGVLSGGERGRLMLAMALAKPSNLMILDEPTNDLDLETLDLLQDMLAEYEGTVMLVSHDRDFLDRVVASTILAEGDGSWIEYAGGYSDMLLQRAPAAAPRAEPGRGAKADAGARVNAGPTPAAAKKMSFKDQHALKTLPGEIAALQSNIAKNQRLLADPKLYAKDRKRFDALTAALAADSAALQKAEDRWLELELMREEAGL